MGKYTDCGWLKEDDPIFTEGITGFTVRKQPEPRVLASGEGKKEALKNSLADDGDTPLARVLQSRKNTEIFTDFILG